MDSKPFVFLAMPHYDGWVHIEAAKAFFLHDPDSPFDVGTGDQGRSLLGLTFNNLWCDALNMRNKAIAEGRRPLTHFAMLHSDVAPAGDWLKVLLEELHACDADLCSLVIPIKNAEGLTSTAIASDNPFSVQRRLTINEVRRLPQTFDAEACGYPGRALLANTGCFVCRLDRPWCEMVRFEIRDQIVKTPEGLFEARVEPEDWHFSRQIWLHGCKVVCTSKIPVRHYGGAFYTMDKMNGLETDRMAEGEPLPIFVRPNNFKFPAEVDGWLSQVEGETLATLARGKRVLEIGSYCGRSTICLAQTAAEVVAVDPHDGRETPRPKNTKLEFLDNLATYGLSDKVTLLTHLNGQPVGPFDLVFIDGAHDAPSVRADIIRTLPLLAKGGLLAFHDYRLAPDEDGWDPGVTSEVNKLLDAGATLKSRHDSLAVVDPAGVTSLAE